MDGKERNKTLLEKEVGREIVFTILLESLYPVFLYCCLKTNTKGIATIHLRTSTLTEKGVVILLPMNIVIC